MRAAYVSHCTMYFISMIHLVQIIGPGLEASCMATVISVSEQTGLATVQLEPPSDADFTPARYSDTVQVPLSRLKPPRNEVSDRVYLIHICQNYMILS